MLLCPVPREKDMAVRVGDWRWGGRCSQTRGSQSWEGPCLVHVLLLLLQLVQLPPHQLEPGLLLGLHLPGLVQCLLSLLVLR